MFHAPLLNRWNRRAVLLEPYDFGRICNTGTHRNTPQNICGPQSSARAHKHEQLDVLPGGPILAQPQLVAWRSAGSRRGKRGDRREATPATSTLTADGRRALGSHIVPITVNSDGDDPAPPTQPASPTAAGATRTADSVRGEARTPSPQAAAPQLRDPFRYHILGEHGRGGLGRVSRAHDRELGRDVAIKELISRGHVSEVRFLREALITARLEHPGIVPVHEAGRWPDGTPFYAMKLVAGRPLRDLLAERTTVDERIALLHHVIAVADAIAYAHGRNIIHRDLKPANIIVGDFGETVVIDWGLAKDLTISEDDSFGGGVLPGSHDDLTSTGSVLGTPAYMPPEQARGEPVDQRADVFAIGAMLWELGGLQKVPPTEPGERHRVLRRAGIDQDLIAIIDKALDPDPAGRYPDAGALAADLKAFKAGARIAARRYSPIAMLTHWTRRHRALALAVATVLVLAVVGSIIYVERIATERDRADTALARVEVTQRDLSVQHAELTLKHAQLLMTSDPTAALDSLATYHGADRDRAAQLRAEAIGRGVARLRAVPHTDSILWLHGVPDGGVISLSTDGTITRTSPDGTSEVLTNGVATLGLGTFSYAASHHLLAYICDPADLCLLDVVHGKRIAVPQKLRSSRLIALTFSPGDAQLALLSATGELRVLDVAALDQPVERLHLDVKDGGGLLFVDEDTIAVGMIDGLKIVHMAGDVQSLVDPESTFWDASPSEHRLVFVTTNGKGVLVETDRLRIATRVTLCHDFVSGVKVIPGKRTIAFACREGTIGTWDLKDGTITPRAHLEGHANMIEVSAAGDYIVAAGDSGVLTVVDLDTELVTSFRGHGFRVTAISPPTAEYPWLLSADVRGGLRAWPMPRRLARVVGTTQQRVFSALFSEAARAVIADTRGPELTSISTTAGVRPLGPHTLDTTLLEPAAQGGGFAAYGPSGVIEIWSSSPVVRTHVFDTHTGPVSHLSFAPDGDDFVTSGKDGRLVRWTAAGEQQVIHQLDQPIESFVLAPRSRAMVVAARDGSLWRVGGDGRAAQLAPGGAKITRLLALPDGVSVCIGRANGELAVVETTSWQQTRLPRAGDAIRDLAVTGDGRTLAVATANDAIRLGVRQGDAWTDTATTWTSLAVRARRLALTHDGLLVAVSTDGTVWVYSAARRTWLCLLVGTSDLTHAVVTGDGTTGVVFDADGHIISIDLAAIRKILDTQ